MCELKLVLLTFFTGVYHISRNFAQAIARGHPGVVLAATARYAIQKSATPSEIRISKSEVRNNSLKKGRNIEGRNPK